MLAKSCSANKREQFILAASISIPFTMRRLIISFLVFWNFYAGAQNIQSPRYNQVYQVATHNSYWVKRAKTHEIFATGTQERILDQLFFDHARGLEIDIHKIKGRKGQWAVYHTSRSKNVFCQNFTDFLKQLQQFQYALPQHEVVTVVLELKEILDYNFDDSHTPADLDSLLEAYVGPYLFRPADLMKRCPGKTNLCDCAASSANIWPTIEELRGKVIFLVLGNFHVWPLGHGGMGWAVYANSLHPSAFPMSSDFSVFGKKGGMKEYVPAPMLERAYKASIFQQVENCYDTAHLAGISKFIAAGGIVRGASSFSIKEQQQRIGAGFNLLQTDYPWLQFNNKGYSMPFRPRDPDRFNNPEAFIEPGNRIFLQASADSFHYLETLDNISDWETLPSTTRTSPNDNFPNPYHTYGKGCLMAASLDAKNFVRICRKVNVEQNAVISVTTSVSGTISTKKFVSNERTCGLTGDYIRMRVEQVAGGTEVAVFFFPNGARQFG